MKLRKISKILSKEQNSIKFNQKRGIWDGFITKVIAKNKPTTKKKYIFFLVYIAYSVHELLEDSILSIDT